MWYTLFIKIGAHSQHKIEKIHKNIKTIFFLPSVLFNIMQPLRAIFKSFVYTTFIAIKPFPQAPVALV